jgi:glycosyltransferase involved in cell wall biosynthesis
MNSLRHLDEIIIADGGSEDKTVELAKSFGATVYTRKDKLYTVKQKDIDEFKKQTGIDSVMKVGDRYADGSEIRNEAISRAKNNWVLNVDADEMVVWDVEEIKTFLPMYDQVYCPFEHTPKQALHICKLFDKTVNKMHGMIHEVVIGTAQNKMVTTDKMKIIHYQKERDWRFSYLARMEYAYLHEKEDRTRLRIVYYLAREYFNYGKYGNALKMYNEYISNSKWQGDMADAYLGAGRCHWYMKRTDEAIDNVLYAIKINPNYKEALMVMSEMSTPNKGQVWRKFAGLATNEGVGVVNVL